MIKKLEKKEKVVRQKRSKMIDRSIQMTSVESLEYNYSSSDGEIAGVIEAFDVEERAVKSQRDDVREVPMSPTDGTKSHLV